MSKFLEKLNKALDESIDQTIKLTLVGGDKPTAGDDGVSLEGGSETAADGSHRFDPAVKYKLLELEREFNSMEHKQSSDARPGLE